MDKYKLNIYLTDFTPLSKAEFIFDPADAPSEHIKNNAEENKKDILIHFFDNIKDKVNINGSGEEDCPFYKDFNGTTYSQGIVGAIKAPIEYNFRENGEDNIILLQITLELRSRFDSKKKPYFLTTMLAAEEDLTLSETLVSASNESIFEILLVLYYIKRLREAAQKGYYKTYVRFDKNDSRPKGCIDIAAHIKQNAGRSNGKIACSYRESTYKNSLNMLILCAYKYINIRFNGILDNNDTLYRIIQELKTLTDFEETKPHEAILHNLRSISHPYFTEYEEMRKICIMILRNEDLNIFGGENDDVESILYYLPTLWENYLAKQIQQELPDDIRMTEQEEYDVYSKPDSNGYIETARPDYVFKINNKPFIILDAKFKEDNKWNETENNSEMDFNDLTKCLRDMVVTGSRAVGTIFPTRKSEYYGREHKISEYTDYPFYTFPVSIPKTQDCITYKKWLDVFTKNISEAINGHERSLIEILMKTYTVI